MDQYERRDMARRLNNMNERGVEGTPDLGQLIEEQEDRERAERQRQRRPEPVADDVWNVNR